ncbi:hypothetical protein IWW34DRAFT_759483 [Fusarium oxysporum f. sp. albedinis]|nr:hypothetical protein IWW34DRAFT_759483 [Fusarium oxysporum f. sp. albedinis]KAJ0134312.1 Tetratricopeptide repeat protein 1 [Fusarium oxysporum f. sp. albedinis]KAK2470448.1 hypothetical protein H9L39_18065 [Fusarium oxysporum f. sp. albedinis]
MYATKKTISSWLDSVPNISGDNSPQPVAAEEQAEHRNKRRKLNDHGHRLPSPPASESVALARKKMSPSTPSSSKRLREDDDNSFALNNSQLDQTTPRPSRNQQAFTNQNLTWEPFSAGTSQGTPSQASSASFNSGSIPVLKKPRSVNSRTSPTRQFRNAEVNETGFNTESLRSDKCPPSLNILWRELNRIGQGGGILPASLESRWDDTDANIPFFAYDRDPATKDKTELADLPSFEWVQALYRRAKDCRFNRESELSWNGDVHAPILEQVFRVDRFTSRGLVDFRWAQAAQIIREFKPKDAPSKMVDFCVFYKPDKGSPEEHALELACKTRPGHSINHTDFSDLCRRPIALSIETKRPHIEGDTATLQVSTWHSAQWRSLRWNHGPTARTIEFLPGIIVQGHEWRFVASVLDQDGKSLLLEEVKLGGTDTELGIYSLVLGLQHLRKWIEEDYWPAFVSDILNTDSGQSS